MPESATATQDDGLETRFLVCLFPPERHLIVAAEVNAQVYLG